MREELRDIIPNDEQQLVIAAQYELDELERKEKLPDSEYLERIEEIKKNPDEKEREIQLQDFLNWHISVSEYEEKKIKNWGWIREVNEKYGIPADRALEERHVEALRLRPQLQRLQNYHERIGSHVMRNVDVPGLSDEEVIQMYKRVTSGVDNETLNRMLNADTRGRIDDSRKERITRAIEKFKVDAENLKKQIDKVKRTLVLDDAAELDVTEAIRGLDIEIRGLDEEANQIIADIDSFKLSTEEADFSMTPAEIKAIVKGFKDRLKDLKLHQLAKYNARVAATNTLIDELLNDDKIDSETKTMLEGLKISEIAEGVVKDWRTSKYLSDIDYNRLVEVNKAVAEVRDKMGKGPGSGDGTGSDGGTGTEDTDTLEQDIAWIEERIEYIDSEIKDDMSKDDAERLKQDVLMIAERIVEFNVKLANNKDKLSEEKYNEYLDRINDAQANLADLNARLYVVEKEESDFKILSEKLNTLNIEVTKFRDLIEALYGFVSKDAVQVLENDLNTFDGRLDEIKKDIEESHKQGKLDENQYSQLMKKVEEIEKVLKAAHEKVKDPGMIMDADIFALLNQQIDGIEAALDKLEEQVDKLEKPIKDKATRKQIDAIIMKLEAEIELIGKHLEMYKDQDPEKYEATKERLDKVKERLDKISKNYRKKCPLLVRAVKSAKDFYKKHKKAVLIAAGLAAIALIHATVGPILIPAIMHGNIMIGATAPALRGFTGFVNNILGGMINASCNVHGVWSLASGAIINPSVASTSLLKGLAISGIGTTALVAPVVIAIKKLVQKMKNADLKKKFTEGIEKGKEKAKKKKEEKEKKPKKRNTGKLVEEEIAQLVRDYRKSGMSLEEFCEQEELTEEEKTILQIYEQKVQERQVETGGKGRR